MNNILLQQGINNLSKSLFVMAPLEEKLRAATESIVRFSTPIFAAYG